MPATRWKTQPRQADGQWAPDWAGRTAPNPVAEETAQAAPPPPGVTEKTPPPPTLEQLHEKYRVGAETAATRPSRHETHGTVDEVNESLTWTLPDGTLHNTDGPALIKKDGTRKHFYMGVLHNAHGPAVTTPHGSEEWHLFGRGLHNANGPAVKIAPEDGDSRGWYEAWYTNNVLHRKDGPAVTMPDGTQMWFQNGKLKRWFGPAVVHGDGRKEWCGVGKAIRITALTLVVMKLFTSRL